MTAGQITPSEQGLRWTGLDHASDEIRATLFGPGAPFELVIEDVLGAPTEVFAQRPRSMSDALGRAAERYPDRVFVHFPEVQLTYREFVEQVDRMAGVLAHSYGIGKGDRLAIVSANNVGFALAIWAAARLGAILVGLNGWWTASELSYGISLTGPSLIVGDERRLERLSEIKDEIDVPILTFTRLMAELESSGPLPVPDHEVSENDPAIIMFTSGTTGRPKGVTQSHRALMHFGQINEMRGALGAALAGITMPPDYQSCSICVSPLFHVSGTTPLFSAPFVGSKIVYPAPGRWDEVVHLELTARHRASQWSGVPTQLFRLLEHPDLHTYDVSSLRSVGSGGSNMPPELIRLIHERLPGAVVGQGYGMTETAGIGTGISGADYVANPTSVGEPVPTCEVQIRRPDGTLTDQGEVGEIYLRTPCNFLGYWDDPQATAAVLSPDRWYKTGDFARVNDNRVYLSGRGSDLIIRGGENISALEVENRLIEHPDVEEAAVIGVDHPMLEQEVLALLVLNVQPGPTADDIKAFVGKNLAAFKVPAHVVFLDELPHTASGKLHKKALEDEWRAMLSRPSE